VLSRRTSGVDLPWFGALVAISASLVAVTLLAYVFRGHGALTSGLFWLALSAEDNIGAWWSGMLCALAAAMAFDGHFDPYKPARERRGWCALAFALLLLSLTEVASLHRYLDSRNDGSLVIFAAVGLALAGYALLQLHRTALPSRRFALLLLGFGLLALVPFLEMRVRDPVLYGMRVSLEEGTEVLAMLVFIVAARDNSVYLYHASKKLFAIASQRRALLVAGAALLPVALAGTFVLPSPGGAANWLTAVLLLCCALLAARRTIAAGRIDARSVLLIGFYVAASAAANAVRVGWSFTVLSTPVSSRGFALAVLIVGAAGALRASGRPVSVPRLLLLAGAAAGSAAVWPTMPVLWHLLPPLCALWLYSIESQAASARGLAPARGVLLSSPNAPTGR
jgi:hypothetical protein